MGKNISNKKCRQKGQAMFVVIGLLSLGLVLMTTNIMVGIIEHDLTLALQQSDQGRALAEAGAEEAVLRLLRNPDYEGGSFVIDEKNVNINVEGDNPKVITSQINYLGAEKELRVKVDTTSGETDTVSWQEE